MAARGRTSGLVADQLRRSAVGTKPLLQRKLQLKWERRQGTLLKAYSSAQTVAAGHAGEYAEEEIVARGGNDIPYPTILRARPNPMMQTRSLHPGIPGWTSRLG
jgi:hypothetical protein